MKDSDPRRMEKSGREKSLQVSVNADIGLKVNSQIW